MQIQDNVVLKFLVVECPKAFEDFFDIVFVHRGTLTRIWLCVSMKVMESYDLLSLKIIS